ncbi:MAG: 3-deoxy-7-phosphoheptulonate synthase [Burkholderiales bacterium]|jgi:3-deoxy-7-phosphoheptulonate synthase|nr:3-deoxy-7-phosphoheptulonate synthase [Betaproteobacteria bacterium]
MRSNRLRFVTFGNSDKGGNPINDTRVRTISELSSPASLLLELSASETVLQTVHAGRREFRAVLNGDDDRLVVIVGPCSVHDYDAAIDYAERLSRARARLGGELLLLMRVYFEKPRTTLGWTGYINDPHLNESYDIETGLSLARSLLLDIAKLGVPAATEYLDSISPRYIGDLVAWAAIGARTAQSPLHRRLASGLSCPVGFKNGTSGDVVSTIDAIEVAATEQLIPTINTQGRAALALTMGNPDCHVVLRGGASPNWDRDSVASVCRALEQRNLNGRVMVDCSHGNSAKQHLKQIDVAGHLAESIADGDAKVFGIMLESNILGGRQDLRPDGALQYGVSITDACIDWDSTEKVLERLSQAILERRKKFPRS